MKLKFDYFKSAILPFAAILAACQPGLANPIELTLDDSIALAFKNNPAPQIAEAYREQAAWAVKDAQASKGFTVDFIHKDMRSTSPLSWMSTLAAISPYNYFSNQLTLSLPLYTGGKLENTIEQAKLNYKVSELELKTTKQELKLDTTVGYYNVLQTENLLKIARQTVDDFNAHLKRVQDMYGSGAVAFHDVLQTKVKLANAENSFVQAQNDYDLAVYSLNKTMGLPLRSEIKLKETLTYQPYGLNLDDATSYGLAHRPEMAQKQAQVEIAEKQVKIAQSNHQPTVSLTGTNAWDDNDFAGANNRDWTAMLITQFNVFDSGSTNSKIRQSQSGKTAAQKQAQQTKDNMSLEISDAYLSMREAEKRIEKNKVAVEEAADSFDIAQTAYTAGVGTNLDVMDAELALNQAKTNYINSLFDYNTSKARLDKAMGMDAGK